jgi:hypothetical protein
MTIPQFGKVSRLFDRDTRIGILSNKIGMAKISTWKQLTTTMTTTTTTLTHNHKEDDARLTPNSPDTFGALAKVKHIYIIIYIII